MSLRTIFRHVQLSKATVIFHIFSWYHSIILYALFRMQKACYVGWQQYVSKKFYNLKALTLMYSYNFLAFYVQRDAHFCVLHLTLLLCCFTLCVRVVQRFAEAVNSISSNESSKHILIKYAVNYSSFAIVVSFWCYLTLIRNVWSQGFSRNPVFKHFWTLSISDLFKHNIIFHFFVLNGMPDPNLYCVFEFYMLF